MEGGVYWTSVYPDAAAAGTWRINEKQDEGSWTSKYGSWAGWVTEEPTNYIFKFINIVAEGDKLHCSPYTDTFASDITAYFGELKLTQTILVTGYLIK